MPKVIHLLIRFVPDLFVLNIARSNKNTSPDICIKFHKKSRLSREKLHFFYLLTWQTAKRCYIKDMFKLERLLRGGAVVARQAHNLKAVGSIPAPATNDFSGTYIRKFLFLRSN